MLDFISVKIIAAAQLIMAAGITYFWINWLRTEHNESWLPTGYLEHERCFVYPDSVMSVMMVVSAILLLIGEPLGERLALISGGMMLFLAIIDIAYFAQNGLFAKDRGGRENLGLVILLIIISLLMILRFV